MRDPSIERYGKGRSALGDDSGNKRRTRHSEPEAKGKRQRAK